MPPWSANGAYVLPDSLEPQQSSRYSSRARPYLTLGRSGPSAAVKDCGGSLGISLIKKSNDRSQVLRNLLENPLLYPAASLLVDSGPSWKIVRQESPLAARADNVLYCIEKIAQRMFALRNIVARQAKIRKKELPFRVRDVAGIGLPCRVHAVT